MKKALFCFIWLFLLNEMSGQTAREYFDSFKQNARQEYENFRLQANAEYVDFLRMAWVEYKKMPALDVPELESIPPVVIKKEELSKPIEEEEIEIECVIDPIYMSYPQPNPIAPIREVPQPTNEYFEFDFFGTIEKVRIGEEHKFYLTKCQEEHIADAWTFMCHERYNNVIRDCLTIRLEQNLCDWAYLELLWFLGQSFYGEDTNEATLLSAFIYCQSGYAMRLAITEEKLNMLFGSKHEIYALPYFEIDNEKFYSFQDVGEKTRLMPYAFESETDMSLYVGKELLLAMDKTEERTIKSEQYPEMSVKVQSNKNLLAFYASYPTSQIGEDFMTRWAMYANTPINNLSQSQLYSFLSPMITGRSQLDAVNRLLNWVQTGFVYEYDDKIWGGDRAFFADETLYYPYCDCEDRSILFSHLVRDLVGLDVVLVYYPGHLATAVKFTEPVNGDYLLMNNERFVIADPTYIGAPVGYTMPDMDNKSAKVILLQK